MNEDPIFYKKLSKLIREVIEEYHQQRINEAEFLKKAREYEETFLKGDRGNIPDQLIGNDTGIAIYNLVTDIFKDLLSDKLEVATELAVGIDGVIRSVVYQGGQLMVDWQNNLDMEGKIRIAVDDYIFDLKSKYDIELSFDAIDETVEEALKVAKIKFV